MSSNVRQSLDQVINLHAIVGKLGTNVDVRLHSTKSVTMAQLWEK